MTPAKGEQVDYHSPFRTGVYDATVIRVNDDGTVAVAVTMPGSASRRAGAAPAVTLRSVTYGPEGRARPKGID